MTFSRHARLAAQLALFLALLAPRASAGPPFISDDPEPTDYRHYEIYAFASGATAKGDVSGNAGIDFNYGATPNLQLTAVVPLGFDAPSEGPGAVNFGQVELAAKWRLLHQDDIGIDLAVFPRLFLPAGSPRVGERNVSLLLPVWIEKDWGKWTVFGGTGCVLNRSAATENYCLTGWTLTRQVFPDLQLGLEVYHQTSPVKGGRASTSIGTGAKFDVTENVHLLGYIAPTLQNASSTARYTWYSSVLFTF